MSDSSIINTQTLNRDASLNTLMYVSKYCNEVADGDSVKSIITQADKRLNDEMASYAARGYTSEEVQKQFGDDLRKITILKNAVESDPGLGRLVIANQSSNMNDPSTGVPYESDGLSVCTFQDNLDNPSSVTVVYQGTGGGEWYDNGLGLSGITVATDQQSQATEYFDYIVKQNGWDTSKPDIYITGHSKGGNKTQYVVMASEYSSLIVNGYSLDGQCMSPEAIEYLKNKYGAEEFNRRREKLYSISADNDYVNVLGINNSTGRIIPDDHIFYLESNLDGIAWHYPDCYMNEDGTVTNFTEQGEVSKILQGVSEQVMDLPAPIRSIITNGAMGIAEMTLGNGKPVNGESFSYADVIAAVPMLLETIPGGVVEYLGNKYGVDLHWLSSAVTAFSLIYYAPLNATAYGIGLCIDFAIAAKEKLVELGEKCKEITGRFVALVDNSIRNLRSWYNKTFNGGFKYALSHTQISVDTFRLRDYANRLYNVNRRIANLDRRMDALYTKVGLFDLWNLLQADALTGYSWRLSRCINYLNDTANEFDSAERSISSQL